MFPSTGTYVHTCTCILFLVFLSPFCTSIGGGWHQCISHATADCTGFIAVITNSYINSEHRNTELSKAHEKQKKIFPVIHKQVDRTQANEVFWMKLVIEEVEFDPDPPNYDYSQTLALLERIVAENSKQYVAYTEVHLKLPFLFSLEFFHCFGFMFIHVHAYG